MCVCVLLGGKIFFLYVFVSLARSLFLARTYIYINIYVNVARKFASRRPPNQSHPRQLYPTDRQRIQRPSSRRRISPRNKNTKDLSCLCRLASRSPNKQQTGFANRNNSTASLFCFSHTCNTCFACVATFAGGLSSNNLREKPAAVWKFCIL